MEDSWEVVKRNNHIGQLTNNDTEAVYGQFLIHCLGGSELEKKLSEDIIKAYVDYHKKEKRVRILQVEVLDKRTLLLREKKSGKQLAEFKLKRTEDVLKDFQLIAKLVSSYESYLKSIL